MKLRKSLREIKSTIIEKDIDRSKDLEIAETILKVASHMGPYALTIKELPTHILYQVNYKLVPDPIRPIIVSAMEALHRNLELRYKEVCSRCKMALKEVKESPDSRWAIEKFNSINQLKGMLELAVPDLKPTSKKAVKQDG
jgi:hypothetical protein